MALAQRLGCLVHSKRSASSRFTVLAQPRILGLFAIVTFQALHFENLPRRTQQIKKQHCEPAATHSRAIHCINEID
jgi:hypothetical protein